MSDFFKRAKALNLSDTDQVSKYDWQAAVLCYSPFTGSAIKVAMIISSNANRDLLAWPTVQTIAFEANWKDVKEVSKATRLLCKHGALEKIRISEIPEDLRPENMKRKGKGTAYRLSAKWAIQTATLHSLDFMRNSQPEHLKPEMPEAKQPEYGGENVHPYGGVDVHLYGVQNVHPNTLKKPEGNISGCEKTQALDDICDSSTHHCETSIPKSGGRESGILNQRYQEIRKQLGSYADDPACERLIWAALSDPTATAARVVDMIMQHIATERRAG
jgi:hypothetical protein